ncbi:unnamed protein product [Caenorhabditis nigoni]
MNCVTGSCGPRKQCNGAGVLIDAIGGEGNCGRAVRCFTDINEKCPGNLAVKRDGRTVACKSACMAYNTDHDCCRGAFGTPHTCKPSETSRMFKDACPKAYSCAYDDATSTFTCRNANYVVQFC